MITPNLLNNVVAIEDEILDIVAAYNLNLDEIKKVFQSLLDRVEDYEELE
jgi:ADP-dependent phosphofructokinase/glucokinase